MAWLLAWVTTGLLRLRAFLLTVAGSVLTFAWLVARFAAKVRTTFETCATDNTAKDIRAPTWLIFESFLAAQARFLGEERAFGALFSIGMAVVGNLWMTASLGAAARKGTWRRPSSAREGCSKNSSATIAADVFEDGFLTGTTLTFVAEFLAGVVSAFQRTAANLSADVLSLDVLPFDQTGTIDGDKRLLLPLCGQSFCCSSLTRTAPLATFVSATVQRHSAGTHAPRLLRLAAIASSLELIAATSA